MREANCLKRDVLAAVVPSKGRVLIRDFGDFNPPFHRPSWQLRESQSRIFQCSGRFASNLRC